MCPPQRLLLRVTSKMAFVSTWPVTSVRWAVRHTDNPSLHGHQRPCTAGVWSSVRVLTCQQTVPTEPLVIKTQEEAVHLGSACSGLWPIKRTEMEGPVNQGLAIQTFSKNRQTPNGASLPIQFQSIWTFPTSPTERRERPTLLIF